MSRQLDSRNNQITLISHRQKNAIASTKKPILTPSLNKCYEKVSRNLLPKRSVSGVSADFS